MGDKRGETAGKMGTDLLALEDHTDLVAEPSDDDSAEDPTVKALQAKLKAAKVRAAKLKAAKAKEAEEARLKAEKEKEEKEKEEKEKSKKSMAYDYKKYSAKQQGASSGGSSKGGSAGAAFDYSKYSGKQQGASSGGSSGGASGGSQYLHKYAPSYAKYANASGASGSQDAGGADWKKWLHQQGASSGGSSNATYFDYSKYSGSQSAGGADGKKDPSLLLDTELSTETDSTVEDLDRKIKAIKQSQEAIKKYAPPEYQSQYLNQTNSELAALEAKLKAAKQNATSSNGSSSSASANLEAAVGMDQSGLLVNENSIGTKWASESVYFCVIGMSVLLAWCSFRVLLPKSSSSNGFSSDLLSAWLHLRRRVLKIDQRPLLDEFGLKESP